MIYHLTSDATPPWSSPAFLSPITAPSLWPQLSASYFASTLTLYPVLLRVRMPIPIIFNPIRIDNPPIFAFLYSLQSSHSLLPSFPASVHDSSLSALPCLPHSSYPLQKNLNLVIATTPPSLCLHPCCWPLPASNTILPISLQIQVDAFCCPAATRSFLWSIHLPHSYMTSSLLLKSAIRPLPSSFSIDDFYSSEEIETAENFYHLISYQLASVFTYLLLFLRYERPVFQSKHLHASTDALGSVSSCLLKDASAILLLSLLHQFPLFQIIPIAHKHEIIFPILKQNKNKNLHHPGSSANCFSISLNSKTTLKKLPYLLSPMIPLSLLNLLVCNHLGSFPGVIQNRG